MDERSEWNDDEGDEIKWDAVETVGELDESIEDGEGCNVYLKIE